MSVKEVDLGTGRTGGRDATTGVIPGRVALSVGCPDIEPPNGWKWTPLSSIAQLESGHTPSRKHSEYWDGNIPWLGIKDATENHGRTLSDTYQHVSALGLENSSARLLPATTVCLSRTASVGFVVVMGRPMATSQDFVNWVCGPSIEPHYLKYVLLAENEALWRFASGTTHQTIYYPEAKAFHVCLPPLAEQKAIAAVLGALDDKIELNRRMNATLEAIARALFEDWMAKNADSIESKVVDEFIAEKILVIGDGYRAKNSEMADSGLPFVRAGNLKADGLDLGGAEILGAAGVSAARHKLGRDGDVCFTSKGTVGRITRVCSRTSAFVYSPQVCFWRSVAPQVLNPHVLYQWMKHGDFMRQVNRVSTQTDMAPYVSLQDQRRMVIELPPWQEQKELAKQLKPIDDQIAANAEQSRTLAILRDTLLTKLLSGELSLRPDHV